MSKKSKLTTEQYLSSVREQRKDKGLVYDYSKVEYTDTDTPIKIICSKHGEFLQRPRDHRRGHGCKICSKQSYKDTCLAKYGVENIFQRVDLIEAAMLARHGVRNPGLMSDHKDKVKQTSLEKYGINWAANSVLATEKRKATNIERYGVEFPTQNKLISKKIMDTKVKTGALDKSNSSIEATLFFRNYIKTKNYTLDQVAFADKENELHEWGYYFDRWYLFDFVAFEHGHRGDADKIIEIVEYHGPFHYNEQDVIDRGNDKAVPWKSKSLTIKESYEADLAKEKHAKENLTSNYKIVWSEKYKKDE